MKIGEMLWTMKKNATRSPRKGGDAAYYLVSVFRISILYINLTLFLLLFIYSLPFYSLNGKLRFGNNGIGLKFPLF